MKILIIGSGPIVIGQAAEFDYSGSQACRALREEGHEIVLVNNNPATIMTDLDFADRTYLEPLVPEVVERIIAAEKPEGILPTLGGQTGLNLAVALEDAGVYRKHGVKLLGTGLEAIRTAEDRGAFKGLLERLGEPVLESRVVRTLEEAEDYAREIGFPLVVRPAYTLGGFGGGFATDLSALLVAVRSGLERSPITEVLLERSVFGWRELEYEVMRDGAGNVITVCNMENLDPMGVHTGDSVVVAPSQTLSDTDYQRLRSASLRIIDGLGIEGGCNVQFALDVDGSYRVIEVNPRVSRSSALASKATGYPIARVAALIAIGKTLPEIPNKVTGTTSACFEPTLDYVVTKIPRWPFDKFPDADRKLGVQMKATGEVMSIGRTLGESMHKALRSLELPGNSLFPLAKLDDEGLRAELQAGTERRVFGVLEALARGWGRGETVLVSGWDPFFVEEMERMLAEMAAGRAGSARQRAETAARLGREVVGEVAEGAFRMVDTCGAEFLSQTRYLYSTLGEGDEAPEGEGSVVVVGGGPIRIGQGIEFDCCCVHALEALRGQGVPAVMVNNNPETVSTDFDMSDNLYFEPLVAEDVLRVVRRERARGVIVQFGGQTSINMARALEEGGATLLGTPLAGIEAAEDRGQIDALLGELGIARPKGATLTAAKELDKVLSQVALPVLVRPSFVLGGRAMSIARTPEGVARSVAEALVATDGRHPVLIDEYIQGKELEIDLVCDGREVHIPGVMEHIERAGVHSGDSMALFPAPGLGEGLADEIADISRRIALALKTVGLLNIQFIHDGERLFVLEVNPRASRTVPFLAKATGRSLARMATRAMLGVGLAEQGVELGLATPPPMLSLKAPVFSFAKLGGVEPGLGPEMKSTGEIMSFGADLPEVLAKTWTGLGFGRLGPEAGAVLVTVADPDKAAAIAIARRLSLLGFRLYATEGTWRALEAAGLEALRVAKISEGPPSLLDLLREGRICLVVNSVSADREAETDGRKIRRASVEGGIPMLTNIEAALALVSSLEERAKGERVAPVRALQDIHA